MGNVHLAFLWHFHQPCYEDAVDGSLAMPWVRYHGIKDYAGMAAILREFPEIRCTVNFSPVLLRQLQSYTDCGASDLWLTAARAEARRLTDDQKAFILRYFFLCHPNLIAALPRYQELRRIAEKEHALTSEEFLDLQVVANLAWFHPLVVEQRPEVARLRRKGRGYTEEDKILLLREQQETLAGVLSQWKELQRQGRVEISLSPLTHAILPLLCDVRDLHAALPGRPLPSIDEGFREDAAEQVVEGVARYREIFGVAPRGMWPSEGSVSEAIVPLLAANGIAWMATDQEILERSEGVDRRGGGKTGYLYRPYKIDVEGKGISVVFRDTELSNLLGFSYAVHDPREAAADFVGRLRAIGASSADDLLVPVILDGENPWENYPGNGVPFLRALYGMLSSEPGIRTTTISEYLDCHSSTPLKRLFPGSWIEHSFAIWGGHAEDRAAWELVARARRALTAARAAGGLAPDALQKARTSLQAAEGSDWFWWFGEEFSSVLDAEFDALFRRHLMNVYRLIGAATPEDLFKPIKGIRHEAAATDPWALLDVVIDGRRSDYFEWISAGHYLVGSDVATMADAGRLRFTDLFFGCDRDNFLLRLDFRRGDEYIKTLENVAVEVKFFRPVETSVSLTTVSRRDGSLEIAVGEIVEMAYPLKSLNASEGDTIEFCLQIREKGEASYRLPMGAAIAMQVPVAESQEILWTA